MTSKLVSAIDSSLHRWEVVVVLSILIPFVLTYLYTLWTASAAAYSKAQGARDPPTLPYYIPFLGHALSFMADGNQTILNGVRRFGIGTPFRLRLGVQDVYMVSGADMVSSLFKTTRQANGNWGTLVALEYAFGTPKAAIPFYVADDSGSHAVPLPGSNTEPQDRIFYIIHKLANTYLSGQSLTGMTNRFQTNLAEAISSDSMVGDEWVELPDLYGFLQAQILQAAIRSIFGDYILSLNPTFIQDFWTWERGVRHLFMRTPRWMVSDIYRKRDKMVEHVKRWHRYALEHYDISKAEEDDVEWEPYFGSKFGRLRQLTFMKFKALDETARAAEDLGVLWASNANAIPAAAWLLIETLRDPKLESQVRSELQSLFQPTPAPGKSSSSSVRTFDIPTLCSSPLLQSMYAEVLRLYVRVIPTRVPVVPSMNLNGWHFPKGETVGCSSAVEAMDSSVWSTGDNNENPLEEFRAERFMVYPDIEGSGPIKIQLKAKSGVKSERKMEHNGDKKEEGIGQSKPQFSLEGLSSTWIPYGGGVRLCPGRHFAKQEMITSMALWLSAYDIELLSAKDGRSINEGGRLEDFKYDLNTSYFGLGTCPPKGPVRCRLRRRKVKA